MKKILSAVLMVGLLEGCVVPTIEDVRNVRKQPTVRPGYIHSTYDVKCPGHSPSNALDLQPVHYYGPDFNVNDPQWRRDEYKKSCRQGGDGDQNGPDAPTDDE